MSKRPRKPATILRRARGLVNVARDALNHDRVTGDNWVQVNQALLHALALLGELRAALGASTEERPIEWMSGCPKCGEEPEEWSSMSEFDCAGCGNTLTTNVREDDTGKHWSFDYAFDNEAPQSMEGRAIATSGKAPGRP